MEEREARGLECEILKLRVPWMITRGVFTYLLPKLSFSLNTSIRKFSRYSQGQSRKVIIIFIYFIKLSTKM
jgi:hypothetical protein